MSVLWISWQCGHQCRFEHSRTISLGHLRFPIQIFVLGCRICLSLKERFQHRRRKDEPGKDDFSDSKWDEEYPTVEPGDYFSDKGAWAVKVLTGNRMIEFLERHIGLLDWTDDALESRARILEMAMAHAMQQDPTQDRQKLLEIGRKKLENADRETLYKLNRYYVNLARQKKTK